MPARNEAWCIGSSARAALQWCDSLIVLEHACTDATAEIVATVADDHPGRVTCLQESSPAWDEATYRQRLLTAAREHGATHVACIDADEMVTANQVGSMRAIAETLQPGECAHLPWLPCWRSVYQYRSDAQWRCFALFADAPYLAYKSHDRDYQIHTRYPMQCSVVDRLEHSDGGVLHLQHASWRRLLSKQALYKMVESIRWPWRERAAVNAMYDRTVSEEGRKIEALPLHWIPQQFRELDVHAPPWQQAECRRLVEEYGREAFDGLNLYGVV